MNYPYSQNLIPSNARVEGAHCIDPLAPTVELNNSNSDLGTQNPGTPIDPSNIDPKLAAVRAQIANETTLRPLSTITNNAIAAIQPGSEQK